MKIAVLGAGAYGTALGGILTENGYTTDYYDPALSPRTLGDVLYGSEIIVSTVPSDALPHLLPSLPKDKYFILASKGFLTDQSFMEFKEWGVLSGPGYADDIKAKKTTFLTSTDERIIKLFNNDYIHFDYTTDRKGVIICGSLKNIYALLGGLNNVTPGTKEHQTYLEDALQEMQIILSANYADPNTAKLHCGIGDLKLTCAPPSRNFTFGLELHKNPTSKPTYTVEGLTTLKRIKSGELIIPKDAKLLRKLIEMSSQWN